jgi:hypothetical protein
LNTIEEDYAWSTHQPLLKALLEMYKPQFIVELGIGIYSTPILSSHNCDEIISIENDEGWMKYICNISNFKPNHQILYHPLDSNITLSTFLKDISITEMLKIHNYYLSFKKIIKQKNISTKLLFVDNFTCCRSIAINTLFDEFDIIVYHDSEGVDWYQYYFNKDLENNYIKYELKTQHRSSTGCFIKKTLLLDDMIFQKNCKPFIVKYCIDNDLDNTEMYLVREE